MPFPASPSLLRSLTLALFLSVGSLPGPAVAKPSRRALQPLGMTELKTLVETMNRDSDFPLVADPLVLRYIKQYRAAPTAFKASLKKMRRYQPMLNKQYRRHDLPAWLLAIPIVESEYRNIDQAKMKRPPKKNPAAGLWMFTASTARRVGLKVSPKLDQRLDPELATGAAMKYLKILHHTFDDWPLALAAYNQGEGQVQKAIRLGESRQIFKLIRQRRLNHYVPKVMAVAILMQHPELLRSGKRASAIASNPAPSHLAH